MVTGLLVVVISQYVQIQNHNIVHLKLIHVNYISINKTLKILQLSDIRA